MPMSERFGKLLSEGIISVAKRQYRKVKAVECEIAEVLGVASHTEGAHQCLVGLRAKLERPFEGIVWVSAKAYPEKKLWLNEVLDTAARVLDYLFVTQLGPEQKRFEVDKLLRTHRVFFIKHSL